MAKHQTGCRTSERARIWASLCNIIFEEFGLGNCRLPCIIEDGDFGGKQFVFAIGCGGSFKTTYECPKGEEPRLRFLDCVLKFSAGGCIVEDHDIYGTQGRADSTNSAISNYWPKERQKTKRQRCRRRYRNSWLLSGIETLAHIMMR